MSAAQQIGICKESSFPYYNYLTRCFGYVNHVEKPPITAYQEAINFRIACYRTLKKEKLLFNIKASLTNDIPVIINFIGEDDSFPLSSIVYTGIVYPTKSTHPWKHAVVIVGYDDATQMIKFRNTWDGILFKWGDGGYGYIRYKDVDNIIEDAWILIGLRLRDEVLQYQVKYTGDDYIQSLIDLEDEF